MAIPKRVKTGGIRYKGYKLDVASSVADYPIALIPSTSGCGVNGLSITPDSAGVGDYFGVAYVDTTATTGGIVIKQIATTVYNLGGGISIQLDFAAMQIVDSGHSIRVTYTNTATVAMPVYITIEAIG